MTLTTRIPNRRTVVSVATVGATALLLASCGGGDDGESGDASGSGEPVSLRMATWTANEGHLAVLNEIADAFVEENPDLVSEIEFDGITEPGQYGPTVTTQIAGGEAPDLMWIAEVGAAEYLESGVLYNLQPVLDETEGYEFDDLIPGAMELWQADGDTYAYPFSSSPFGIYVNSDLIAAAGQPDPRDLIASGEWTWDAVTQIAAATMESQGIPAGVQLPTQDPYTSPLNAIMPIGLAWGAMPWSEDGTECAFDSDQTVDFMTWYHENVYGTQVFPENGEAVDFATGQTAFRVNQLSYSAALAEAGFTWDFLPLPEGPAGAAPVVGQGAVGVVANSDNPEIAAQFLAFFTNPENSAKLAQFFPPPRKSLMTVETLSDAASALNEEQITTTVIEQATNGRTNPSHANLSEMSDGIRAGLDALWSPDADIEGVLTEVCTQIEPALTS